MHMADALVSPAVGGTMWVAAAAGAVHGARRIREEDDPAKVPLAGVVGAFVFAAQMVNFAIPGTGSSGHLGGGLILAILLGPEAAFLTMASVLTVQALFFADGGLLALGCNIMNLAFFPAFIAYPLVFKRIVGERWTRGRIVAGSILGALVGLELGAFAVVAETTLSGVSSLPFSAFVAMMLPIHLVIGCVEGLVTAAVVVFVARAQPELLSRTSARERLVGLRLRTVVVVLLVVAIVAVGLLARWASTDPDGLEWSIAKVTGSEEFAGGAASAIADAAARLQEKTAFLPDYGPRESPGAGNGPEGGTAEGDTDPEAGVAGLVGAGIILALAALAGFGLSRRHSGRHRKVGA